MNWIWNVAIILVLLVVAGYGVHTATSDDLERIQRANVAASLAVPRGAPEGVTSIFDLRNGNCFSAQSPDLGSRQFQSISNVSCETSWNFRVVDMIRLTHPSGARYPGEEHMELVFSESCPSRSTHFFYPTSSSWDLGDRVVTCLSERPQLS